MFETLLLVGIACVIAAVVGGGVKLFNLETPEIRSLWRQAGLATVGLAIIAGDVAFDDRATSPSAALPAPTTSAAARPSPIPR